MKGNEEKEEYKDTIIEGKEGEITKLGASRLWGAISMDWWMFCFYKGGKEIVSCRDAIKTTTESPCRPVAYKGLGEVRKRRERVEE